jgi:protein TonB
MFERNPLVPKRELQPLVAVTARKPNESRQHRLMVGALLLLLGALSGLLYKDRDFWFPDTQEAEDQLLRESTSALSGKTQTRQTLSQQAPALAKEVPAHHGKSQPSAAISEEPEPGGPSMPSAAITERTVLAPLEVEVVAGNRHQTVRPGSNSVRVDLQPGSPPQSFSEAPSAASPASPTGDDTNTAASVTSNAAEHVEMSADVSAVVSHSVQPGYPLLARQMRVQGSVILQALIGRDGLIQGLRVVSGPPILANAAEEAVKQWHFKPHYQGAEAVETQAKITVNFTISTN